MQHVTGLRTEGDHHVICVGDGTEVRGRTVVLATGVEYRRLGVSEVEAFIGAGVYYGSSVGEAQACAGSHAYVVGGGNSAGQAALYLAKHAAQVSILVRGDSLAGSMSPYLREEIDAAPNVDVQPGTQVVGGGGRSRLDHLVLRDVPSGADREVAAGALFLLIGARPHTDWLPPTVAHDPNGFLLTGAEVQRGPGPDGWPLERAPYAYETSLPGVFAVGDVRARSVKRVASAVGEGSVVIQQIGSYLQG